MSFPTYPSSLDSKLFKPRLFDLLARVTVSDPRTSAIHAFLHCKTGLRCRKHGVIVRTK